MISIKTISGCFWILKIKIIISDEIKKQLMNQNHKKIQVAKQIQLRITHYFIIFIQKRFISNTGSQAKR